MTVKDQLTHDLLADPTFIKNKWACYNQWFNTCSTCMRWENGQLIDKTSDKKQLLNMASAFDEVFSDAFEGFVNDQDYSFLYPELEMLKNKCKMIAALPYRMIDFTCRETMPLLSTNSLICHLPEDGINDDWKEACREYYTWLKDNIQNLDEVSQGLVKNIQTSWLNN